MGRTDPDLSYEVLLTHEVPDAVLAALPHRSMQATEIQTSLRAPASSAWQLDVLIEKLTSLGVPLLEVHWGSGPLDSEPTYEVRVAGEVGESFLHHLGWSHHVVPRQTRIRLIAELGTLHQFLQACTACGAGIQRVHRLTPAQHSAAT